MIEREQPIVAPDFLDMRIKQEASAINQRIISQRCGQFGSRQNSEQKVNKGEVLRAIRFNAEDYSLDSQSGLNDVPRLESHEDFVLRQKPIKSLEDQSQSDQQSL